MRSYTNAASGKVDSAGTALVVTNSVRNSAVVTNSAPQVICEWKMNSVTNCRGVNDLSGGDDFFSSLYNNAERKIAKQDKKFAESFASPWREMNNITTIIATANTTTAALARKDPWNGLYTKFYPASDSDGLRTWTSPKPSVAVSSAFLRSKKNTENSAKAIDVKDPKGPNNSHNRAVVGIDFDTGSTGWLLFHKALPKKPTGKKDKFDWYMPGNKIDLLENATLRNGNAPVAFSGSLARTILAVQHGRNVVMKTAIPSGIGATLGVAKGKRTLYFYDTDYGLLSVGAQLTIGGFTTTVAEHPTAVKVNGFAYTKVIVSSDLPATFLKKGAGQKVYAWFPAAVKISTGAATSVFGGFSIAFYKPVIATPIVVSKVTNSTQLQGELNNLAKLGGCSVQYSKNITWTSKTKTVTIPANMSLNFVGRTLTGTGTTGTYMINMGSTNHRVSSGKTNISITGGTWNVGGATGTAVGCMNVIGVSGVKISFATISNFSNAPGIFMRGCMDTRIVACNISTSVNHSTNHNNSAAIAINSYENNKEYNACNNIQINHNTLASKYGIRSNIFATGLIGSHKNIKINNNTITGDIAGIELSDYDQYAIMYNTLTVGAGMNGINIFSARTSSTYGYIYSNSILGASVSKHIYLTGTSSDIMVGKVNCIDNITNGTGGNTNGGPTTMIVSLDYAAVIFVESKVSQTTTTNTTAHTALAYTGTVGQTYNQIRYVQPKLQYYTDKAEVTQVRQLGKKLEVWLSEPLESLAVGNYVNFDGIHPAVDGDKKVLRITYDMDGIARRTKLVLESNLSQTICREGTSNKAVPAPWPLEKDDDTGYAHIVKDVQANKITVKFDIAYGTPHDAVVQTKHNGSWSTVYTFDHTVTPLSNELERDAEYPSTNNIRALTIYRASNGTWSTTESHFDPSSNINSVPIDAVRVIVGTTMAADQFIGITEISARLSADLTTYTKSFQIDKELGDPNDLAPVGTASTNTGQVSFSNDTSLFSDRNVSGPFYGLFVKNAVFHIYMNYTSGSVYKTKLGTMMSDAWTSDGRAGAEVTLVDKSIVLQRMKCRDFVVYNTEDSTSLPMSRSIQSLLDSVGFSNYEFHHLNDLGKLEFIWSKKEQTPWEVLKEIALAHQMSIYFDEIGRLQVMSRGYIYPKQKEILCSATGAGNTISAAYASDLDDIRPGTPVYWAGGAFTSKIDSGAVVASVNRTSRTITLFGNNVNGSFTDVNIGFGRATNYGVIGSNIDNDRIIDRLELKPVRRTRSWTVSTNEALPTTSGIPAATLEKKPLCSIIRQQAEFYVNTYQSTAGNAVTLSVYPSEDDNVSIPNTGSQVYVKNVGAGFDGIYTLTGRSALGSAWLLNYTGTAGLKAVDSDAAGVVGWTTTEAGYKIYGLEVGKQYKFDGYVYIPSTNTSGYTVACQSDASVTASSPASITTKGSWVSFAVNFTADNTEHIVKYAITNGTNTDALYIYDEEAYYNDTAISEGGYDEVVTAQTTKIDRANKVIVTYKPLNKYGNTEDNGAVLTSGKEGADKALLYQDSGEKILATFPFQGFLNGRFLYDASGMNQPLTPKQAEVVGGTQPKPVTVADMIPLKGKFEWEGQKYEWVGLWAKPAELKYLAKEMLIKNDNDLAYCTELNNGIQPTYTGQGELKRAYSMDIYNFNDPYDPTKSTYIVPKNLHMAPLVSGMELPADLDGSTLVWSTKLKAAQHFGAEFSITTIENSTMGKMKSIALFIYQDLNEGYQFGFMFNSAGFFSAYGVVSYNTIPKAPPGTKVHPVGHVKPLKVLNYSDTKDITKTQLYSNAQRLEVVCFNYGKMRVFDLYLGRRLLGRFMDDNAQALKEVEYKSSMWVHTGAGAGVVVSSTYAIENKKGAKREDWYDPATHNEEVKVAMVKWADQIRADETARNNKLPKKKRLSAAALDARVRKLFELAKKDHKVAWINPQSLTDYLNEAKKTGATIDRNKYDDGIV